MPQDPVNPVPYDTEVLDLSSEYESADEDLVPLYNFYPGREETRAERASRIKQEKLSNLSSRNDKGSLDSYTYTLGDDNSVLSNKNRLWNDNSLQDMQNLGAFVKSQELYVDPITGKTINKATGEEYTGETRRFYSYGTKGDDGYVKYGVTRGDYDSSDKRFTGRYPSGELGVDINKKRHDLLLPAETAEALEYAVHGNRRFLEDRVVKDKYDSVNTVADLGSGYSEYYKNPLGIFQGEDTDLDKGKEQLYKFLKGVESAKFAREEAIRAKRERRALEDYSALDRAGNTLAGALSGFTSSGVNLADAFGEATGLYDLGDEQQKTRMVDDWFNYNRQASAKLQEYASEQWDTVIDSDKSTKDRLIAAGKLILEGATTPELYGDSIGYVASLFLPGTVLKAVGVGSKTAKGAYGVRNIAGLSKDPKKAEAIASRMTDAQKRKYNLKQLMSKSGAARILADQAGVLIRSVGNINDQYEEFVKNNNGKELEGADKSAWFARSFLLEVMNNNLDRFVSSLFFPKSKEVKETILGAVKTMDAKSFAKLTRGLAKGLGSPAVVGAKVAGEGVQEYLQTTAEIVNTRLGTEQYGADNIVEFLGDKRNFKESGIAFLLGISGGIQFQGVGTAGSLTRNLAGKGYEAGKAKIDQIQEILKQRKEKATADKSNESEVTLEELADEYST